MNSETIAQKSLAYDMPGVRIDGNDCFAAYFETKKAFEYARKGHGPTLIEAITWRTGAHTTADDPTKYRQEDEGKEFADPIDRLEKFMKNYNYWDEEWIAKKKKETEIEIEEAVNEMERFPPANVEDLFNHVFEQLPHQLIEQKDKYLAHLRG